MNEKKILDIFFYSVNHERKDFCAKKMTKNFMSFQVLRDPDQFYTSSVCVFVIVAIWPFLKKVCQK